MREDTRKAAGRKDADTPARHDNATGDRRKNDDRSGPGTLREIGGRSGPDPTRYGDWEKNGRCIDF